MTESKKLIKRFGNLESKIENRWRQSEFFNGGFQNIPSKLHEEIKHKWIQKKLLWERREIENRAKKERMKKLINKQPGSLTSEVGRLVAKRFQTSQEWIKEREEKVDQIKKDGSN